MTAKAFQLIFDAVGGHEQRFPNLGIGFSGKQPVQKFQIFRFTAAEQGFHPEHFLNFRIGVESIGRFDSYRFCGDGTVGQGKTIGGFSRAEVAGQENVHGVDIAVFLKNPTQVQTCFSEGFIVNAHAGDGRAEIAGQRSTAAADDGNGIGFRQVPYQRDGTVVVDADDSAIFSSFLLQSVKASGERAVVTEDIRFLSTAGQKAFLLERIGGGFRIDTVKGDPPTAQGFQIPVKHPDIPGDIRSDDAVTSAAKPSVVIAENNTPVEKSRFT